MTHSAIPPGKNKYHTHLSNYFKSQTLYFDGDLQQIPNIRKCSEQPWQQIKAELWDDVTSTLCHLDFIQAKAQAKLAYDLIRDYNDALENLPENQINIITEKQNNKNLNTYFAEYLKFINKEIRTINVVKSVDLDLHNSWVPFSLPKRIDLLKSFSRFMTSEMNLIVRYYHIPTFICQLAYNENDDFLRMAVSAYKEKLIKKGYLFFEKRKIFYPQEISIPVENKISIAGNNIPGVDYQIESFFVDFTFSHVFIVSESILQKWNIKKSVLTEEFLLPEEQFESFCLTPDCGTGIFATRYKTKNSLIVYSLEKKETLLKSQQDERILFLGIIPDGKYGFTEFSDSILIWDIKRCSVKKEIKLVNKNKNYTQQFFFINNYEYLLYDEFHIRIKNIETDKLILEYKVSFVKGIELKIRITPDNKYCFIITQGLIYKVDLARKLLIEKSEISYSYTVNIIRVTADGRHIYFTNQNKIFLYRSDHKDPALLYTHTGEIVEFELSADGKYGAISGVGENCISVLNFEKRESLKDTGEMPYEAAYSRMSANSEYIFSAHGYELFISCNNEIIKKIRFPLLVSDENFAFDISSDGSRIAYAIGTCRATIRDYARNSVYDIINPNESQITSLSISPDNRLIASADYGNGIVISNLKDGKHITTLRNFKAFKAMTVRFSPSSEYIATSADNKILIWKTINYELIATINAHNSWITGLLFSPDGKILLSASDDREIKAWDTEDFSCLNILKTKGFDLKLCPIVQDKKLIVANLIYNVEHSIVIELYNYFKVPFTTLIRTWKFMPDSEGHWDKSYSYYCSHCESKIYNDYQIEKILSQRFFRVKADSENKKDLKILKCGGCGKDLILNDFIIN